MEEISFRSATSQTKILMYIEFPLPHGAGGAAAGMALVILRQKLVRWSEQHNITYTAKIYKHTYRISFDDDRMYSFFISSWNTEGRHWFTPVIKDPMKIDRTRD